MAFTDGGEQQVLVGVVHRLENRRKDRLFEDAASSEPLAAKRLDEIFSTFLDRALATLPDVPLLDLVGRPSAGDELQPVAARPAPSTLEVKTSTESPDSSRVSSDTRRPLTLAPTQRCPTSV